jgi:CheY-like chemotaxis protein
VDAHEGTVTADSLGEGQGATFIVKLPLLKDESIAPATALFSSAKIDLTGIKVLAVDDSEDSRELLALLLAQYGAEVRVVALAEEVLALVNSFKPHVLVCDIGMPGMDGYTLLQQIRALPVEQGGNIPAIALTAYAKEEDHQYALSHGFQKHIAKPVEPERLVIAVAELVMK